MRRIDIDQKVLDLLQEMGSDPSKPHDLEFFLYFPTEESAELAANVIRKDEFDVEVHSPLPNDNRWLCFATKRMIPEHDELIELRQWFYSIADELNGEYDGWGTGVIG